MLRTRLLTATAALAVLAAPFAVAQDAMTPAPQDPTATPMTPTPAPPTPAPTDPAPTDPARSAPQTVPATPSATTATPSAAQAATPVAGNTVVDVLRSNGQFATLLTALDAAQLTETLSSQPAISIFAPTDAAFAAVPEAERTRLMDPANVNELRQLLLYHVVVADVTSSQIQGARGGVETAARSQVQLDGTGEALKIDNATVVQADIDASNGAIFAIDQVLNPATSLAAMGDEEAVPSAAPADDDATSTDAPADDDAMDAPVDDEAMGAPMNAPSTADPIDPTTTSAPDYTADPRPVGRPTQTPTPQE